MAKPLQLEFRIAHAHLGRRKTRARGVKVHKHNPYWSYARHLPADWNKSKIELRRDVASELLKNLSTMNGGKMDLSPLRNDQRAAGKIYGTNPLQNMYKIILELARQNPSYPFYGKWGGGKPELPGKGFAFYVEDEGDAYFMVERLKSISTMLDIPLDVRHRFGISRYRRFVTVDETLTSEVTDPAEFKRVLDRLCIYPHFFHELFLER